MSKVMRYDIADWLNVGTTLVPEWALLGTGVNTLNENPNAQIDTKTYINDKSATSSVKSYQPQFPFDCDLMTDEKAVMFVHKIGRNQLTGSAAETDYIKVDLYDPCVVGSTQFFKARKFRVSIEVSGAAGAGGETVVSTGNLNSVGDVVLGYWDTVTKTFTEGDYTQTLGVLTVVSAVGTLTGDTKITVTPTLASGHAYMYKTSTTVTIPSLDDSCITGYTPWNGASDITAVTGNEILIVEVDGTFKAKKAGKSAVTSKA